MVSVASVNVGQIREVEWRGRLVTTAIWKEPVPGRVALRGVNFAGDDQADRTVHGGVDKAVYAYAQEDYDHWREHERIEVQPGLFGENLTLRGIDLRTAVVGERWSVGTAVLEVAQPRLPCFKLGIRMADAHFPKRFMRVGRMGAYFRIIEEGDVGAGDTARIERIPEHGITLAFMVEALDDPAKAMALRMLEQLPAFWRKLADAV